MPERGRDSLKVRRSLSVAGESFDYFSLPAAEAAGIKGLSHLPVSLKILAENLLRWEDGETVTPDDLAALSAWVEAKTSEREIAYRPARVLMQDFTGVPAVADLAAMRDAMAALGGDPRRINPVTPVDLVIDHSVMVDVAASPAAPVRNMEMEFERNGERYAFLRWGQTAFANFRVVPPGTGICHQVNLEYLAQVVHDVPDGDRRLAFPDTVVGTDSHTTMVNGLAVLGWGVGGIEAEAAMLGQPVAMLLPEVVGVRMTGRPAEGVTATDLVLTVTERLRKKGVVGKFVEFFGPGLDHLPLTDRATIANMAPEYGATCGFFPVDAETLRYLEFTGRDPRRIRLVEAYARAQGMWRDIATPDPVFSDVLDFDMGGVEPSVAGPKRPQDRIPLGKTAAAFRRTYESADMSLRVPVGDRGFSVGHGDVMIAAITSCTNTSNPVLLVTAGLLAKRAVERGLSVKPWVKTSFAPGSQVAADYLRAAGLMPALEALGFHVVAFGCTTCIGNSGPLSPDIAKAVEDGDLTVAAVLSGNRNFEGRISPLTRANYLASPPLVVAYALAGSMAVDLTTQPLGMDRSGHPVFLSEIWPEPAEVRQVIESALSPGMYRRRYADVFTGPEAWQKIKVAEGLTYAWDAESTYVRRPPYFDGIAPAPPGIADIGNARVLAMLGDSVTTDHISPAGDIKASGPAALYLDAHGVPRTGYNSFGSRRGNHEVLMRGTFANIRLKNELAPGTEGGVTRLMPDGEEMPIFDAARIYRERGVPLVVIAGREYGTGSSRDWAAKGPLLLGVRAVIAESFERIHRSNLAGMGILPIQFKPGVTRATLGLTGSETFSLSGLAALKPRAELGLTIVRENGTAETVPVICRLDTASEIAYVNHGGILSYVLRHLASA